MLPLKQSTTLTIPVFAHDVNGDAVTGMVDGGFTKRISKNGGAFAAMTVTITEMENGWYSVPLSTAHTDTLGVLSITLTNASAKQINLQFRVHARLPDDMAYPTTTGRSIDVTTGGAVGIDWANVEGQSTTVNLSATTTNLCNTITTYTNNTPQTGDTFAQLPTNFSDLAITVTSGLVDITQTAADKVWATATRILTAATNITSTGGTTVPQTGDGYPIVNHASYGNAQLVRATTPANTLDVNATGEAGIDLDNTSGTLAKTTDITGFNDLSAADVNAEVVDVINTDTSGEPAQGAPPVTASLRTKMDWLYKFFRNKVEVTATQISIYDDAGAVVDSKSTISDDATTYTRGEFVSGP